MYNSFSESASQPEPSAKSDVYEQLDILHKVVMETAEYLKNVSGRLSPVLSQKPEVVKSDSATPPADRHCGLASRIIDETNDVGNLGYELKSILSRLQI